MTKLFLYLLIVVAVLSIALAATGVSMIPFGVLAAGVFVSGALMPVFGQY